MEQQQGFHRGHANHHQQDDWDEVHNQLLAIQKKSLEVSDPNDADEKEADEVARKVMSDESAEIHGTGGTINRKGEGSAETTPEFQSKLQSSKGGGESLDNATRGEMESKMNADFSGVKIHTGSEAHAMNESVNAKAFAHGQDVFFKQGEFNANSDQGKELLAHELVHTVQQSKSSEMIHRFTDTELDEYFATLGSHTIEIGKTYEILDKWKQGDARYILTLASKKHMLNELLTKPGDAKAGDYAASILETASKIEYFSMTRPYMPEDGIVINLASLIVLVGPERYGQIDKAQGLKEFPTPGETISTEKVVKYRNNLQENAAKCGAGLNYRDCVTVFAYTEMLDIYENDPETSKKMTDEFKRLGQTPYTSEPGENRSKFIMNEVGNSLVKLGVAHPEQKLLTTGSGGALSPGGGWDQFLALCTTDGWHFFGIALSGGSHTAAVWIDKRPGGPFLYFSDQYPVYEWDLKGGEVQPGSLGGFKQMTKDQFNNKLSGYTFWPTSFWKIRSILPGKEKDETDRNTLIGGLEALYQLDQKAENYGHYSSEIDDELNKISTQYNMAPMTKTRDGVDWKVTTIGIDGKEVVYKIKAVPKAPNAIYSTSMSSNKTIKLDYVGAGTTKMSSVISSDNSYLPGQEKTLSAADANAWQVVAATPYVAEGDLEEARFLLLSDHTTEYANAFPAITDDRIYVITTDVTFFVENRFQNIPQTVTTKRSLLRYQNGNWTPEPPSELLYEKTFESAKLPLYQKNNEISELDSGQLAKLGLDQDFINLMLSKNKFGRSGSFAKFESKIKKANGKQDKPIDQIRLLQNLDRIKQAESLTIIHF